jgi:hypothetical protein
MLCRIVNWSLWPYFVVALIMSTAATHTAMAKDHRHAIIHVQNNTGKDIDFVTVAHKYSNDYKNHQTWGNLPNSATTSDGLEVDYTTGFLTTGRDWWLVTWKFKGENMVHFTDPQNFRGIVDALEKAALAGLPEAGKAAGGAVAGKPGAAIGGPAAERIGTLFLNNESTDGFKQHILRDEDSKEKGGKSTVIEIGGEVTFRSPSGVSTTRVGSAPIK